MPGGRPARPMYPATLPLPASPVLLDDTAEGALAYDQAAAFIGVSVALLRKLVERGELVPVYEGTKPRILKRHLQQRLARQLEESLSQAPQASR